MKNSFLRINIVESVPREEAIRDVLYAIQMLGQASVTEIGRYMTDNFGYTYEYKLIYALCSHLAGAKVKKIGRLVQNDGYTKYFIIQGGKND